MSVDSEDSIVAIVGTGWTLTSDEPLDRIDEHGAQRPEMLSSLFCVDI